MFMVNWLARQMGAIAVEALMNATEVGSSLVMRTQSNREMCAGEDSTFCLVTKRSEPWWMSGTKQFGNSPCLQSHLI